MFKTVDEKTVYNIIIVVYLIIGLLYTFIEKRVPHRYSIILAFCLFKILFNYRKCTISYIECKARGVKKEDGILGSLLDHVVDLRNTKFTNILYPITALILFHTDTIKEKLRL